MELLPHEVVVRLGAFNLTNTNETGVIQRNVSKIFIHPDWDSFERRFDADVAILVLSENVTFNNNIQPVCIPTTGFNGNMVGTVVGYSFRKGDEIHAEIPRRVVVRAVSSAHCFRQDDAVRPYSSDRTFCGGTIGICIYFYIKTIFRQKNYEIMQAMETAALIKVTLAVDTFSQLAFPGLNMD